MAHTRKPTMAITMGDPAGIGPEITLKTIQDERIHDICDPFVIGSADSLERAAEIQGVRDLKLNVITEPEQLLDFNSEGYAFCAAASSENEWVFRRGEQ